MRRYSLASMLTALILASGSLAALAQEPPQPDPDKVKKDILDKVRARIQEEHKKIMERLARIIDDEFAKAKPPVEKPPVEKPPVGDAAKRIRELQKKANELQDQLDGVMVEIRSVRREEEDASFRKEAKSVPEDQGTVKEMFDGYLADHNAATEEIKKNREKGAAGFKKSIAGFKTLYYKFSDRYYGAVCAYNVACGYALTGDKDQAIDWLEIAVKTGYGTDGNDFDHMKQDTDLDSLRKERRYLKLTADK